MHLDDDAIQLLIDGELPEVDAHGARAHTAGCEPCRRRLDGMRDQVADIAALLATLDVPAPAASSKPLADRARALRSRGTRLAIGWAAAVIVATVAVAAPGSPVRKWVGDAARWVTGAAPSQAPSVRPAEPDGAGIALDPGTSFVIVIDDRGTGGTVHVRWSDDPQLSVQASHEGAVFTADPERLRVEIARDAIDLEIAVPRSAAHVEIRSAGRLLWTGERGHATSDATPDVRGTWRISTR